MIRKNYAAGHRWTLSQDADWPESVSQTPGSFTMLHNLVARLGSARTTAAARTMTMLSNAWTRTAFEPAAARRIAGLRYWDGPL